MSGGFTFRPAKREGVHLLIGLVGGTGAGKTLSALRLARGLAGPDGRIAVIDTEAGRAKHHADAHVFDHGDLQAPFSPDAYLAAIQAADAEKYDVIVVDSMSHEHAGDGGLLDMHEAEFQRLGGRDAVKMTAWIKPKMAHKAMVQKLLQLRSHLILCFRAEPKIRIEKDGNGKTQIVDAGWQAIAAKGLEFELTASFLLSCEHPGWPDHPLKLPSALRSAFPADVPIGEDGGRAVATWASGTIGVGTGKSPPLSEVAAAALAAIGAIETPKEEPARPETIDQLVLLFAESREAWLALPAAEALAIKNAIGSKARLLGIDGLDGLKRLAARRKPADEPGSDG